MKKNMMAIAGLIAIGTTISCHNNLPNVVDDFEPVSHEMRQGFDLDAFKAADSLTKIRMINDNKLLLFNNINRFNGGDLSLDEVEFTFGSGVARKVEHASGIVNKGRFENELIVLIHNKSHKGAWILACSNGMLGKWNFDNGSGVSYGTANIITIYPGQSLATYWPELEEWVEQAKDLPIAIRGAKGDLVSYDTYKNTLRSYKSLFYPYDQINLVTGKVTNKAGQEVDFVRRQSETKKANKEPKVGKHPKIRRGWCVFFSKSSSTTLWDFLQSF